jgi:hypothetical protein
VWVLRDSDHWQIALQITDPSSRQRGRPKTKSKAIVRQKKGKRRIWSCAPMGCPTPRRIGRLTVGHNIDSTHRTLPNARWYNWATLFLGEINTGTWPSMLEESKNRNNKMCFWVLWDSNLRKAELAISSKEKKLKNYRTDFSSERAPHITKSVNCLKIIKERGGKIGRGSHMGAWHQDRLAD